MSVELALLLSSIVRATASYVKVSEEEKFSLRKFAKTPITAILLGLVFLALKFVGVELNEETLIFIYTLIGAVAPEIEKVILGGKIGKTLDFVSMVTKGKL